MLRESVMVLVLVAYTLGSFSLNSAEKKLFIEEKKSIPTPNIPSVNSITVKTTPEPLRVFPTDEPVNIIDWLRSYMNSNSSELFNITNRIGLDDYLLSTPKLDK